MSISIPEKLTYLLEQPVVASLATIMPDGLIQVNPVWIGYDGTHIQFSSLQASQKSRNVQERGFATMLLVDPQNAFAWIEIRGRVSEATTEGAFEFIDVLAKKYLGLDKYPNNQEGDVRFTYTITPERIKTSGA
jgi:PPOX class probable F420-dependent enzyme